MVGETPFGPFEMQGTGDIHPEQQEVIPYASQLVNWQGEWLMMGTVVCSTRGQQNHDYITDPISLCIFDAGLRSVW